MNCDQYTAHVGYTSSALDRLFSPETLLIISIEVTKNLRELLRREITVPLDIISNVLNALYRAYRPPVGGNMGVYNQPHISPGNIIDNLVGQAITLITQQIYAETLTEQNAANLTVWTTVLGTHNSQGLRAHPQLKLSTRRSGPIQFNMQI